MIKCGPADQQTYKQIGKAIPISQPKDKYDYITTVKGLECSSETGGWKMLSTKNFCLDKFIIAKNQIYK